MCLCLSSFIFVFFFNDTATTEIYTLSLHDALPIYSVSCFWKEDDLNKLPRMGMSPMNGIFDSDLVSLLSSRPASAKLCRSEEHTSELQSQSNLVCRLLLEKKKRHIQPTLAYKQCVV